MLQSSGIRALEYSHVYTYEPFGECVYQEKTSDKWDIPWYTTRKCSDWLFFLWRGIKYSILAYSVTWSSVTCCPDLTDSRSYADVMWPSEEVSSAYLVFTAVPLFAVFTNHVRLCISFSDIGLQLRVVDEVSVI